MPPPRLMKCHYEVLDSPRDADADLLKKQYRRMALKFHPDKNPEDPEGAKEAFQVIQQAYDVLSDPQERAWYDSHREEILRGGRGEQLAEDGIDLFQYFSSSCFSGWGDDDCGFYGVFCEVFNVVAKEDMEFMEEQDDDFEVPTFGKSTDEYESVGAAFYSYWAGYSTPRTFSWLDKYDTRQAENRWMRRKMEQENKTVREAARKERNTVVRNLVAFVRKRDRRVAAYRRRLELKAEENKKKTQEFQKKQRQERKKLLETGGAGNDSFGMSGLEDQLRQLEGQYTDSEEEEEEQEDDDDDDEEQDLGGLEELYCVACDKICKSMAAKENHETSRKHKDNMEKLIEEMKVEEDEDDEEEEDISEDDIEEEKESIEEIKCVVCDENFKTTDAKSKHESSKKHRKNLKLQEKKTSKVKDEETEKPDDCDKSDLVDNCKTSKKKGKGKNRRRKDKDDSEVPEEEENINPPTPEDTDAEKENCENSKDIDDMEEDVIEQEKPGKSKKGGKSKKIVSDPEDDLVRGNLNCAQCKAEFPSKNKLYNHLKSTGHAVFLPKVGGSTRGGSEKETKQKIARNI